jgi:transcription elongation factor Elf1
MAAAGGGHGAPERAARKLSGAGNAGEQPTTHRRQRRTTTGNASVVKQHPSVGTALEITAVKSEPTPSVSDSKMMMIDSHQFNVVEGRSSSTSTSPSVVVLHQDTADNNKTISLCSGSDDIHGSDLPETPTTTVKTEPDCELFDVNLNAMLESADQSFEDFWQNFDLDTTSENTDEAGSSTTETASSSPETTDSEMLGSDDTTLLKDLVDAASSATAPGLSPSASGKRFDCTRCEKRFASAATLEKHLLVHAEIRPYRCSVCDIGFKLKVHLKKHNLYRHSEEYPCECSICGKRFKDSSAVRLHERIHSSDRPFQCAHCGKSFKTRENLWGHRNRGPCEKSAMVMTSGCSGGGSSPSVPSHIMGIAAGSETDVTQRFVANNVRLFHSAEFGPILGVPVSATKLVLKEVRDSNGNNRLIRTSDIETNSPVLSLAVSSNRNVPERPSNLRLNLPSTSIAGTTIFSTSNGCALPHQRVSAIRIGQTQTRTALSNTSSVPTAVVTPIKREAVDAPPESSAVIAIHEKPPSASRSPLVQTTSVLSRTVVISRAAGTTTAAMCGESGWLPDMRKRSKSASIAEQCPTVQKYLTLGHRTVNSNNSNMAVTHKLLETTPYGTVNPVATAATVETTAEASMSAVSSLLNSVDDEFSTVEHNLTDAINVLTESIMSDQSGVTVSDGAMSAGGDCLSSVVDGLTGPDVDWPSVGEDSSILGPSSLVDDGQLNKVGNWTDLMSSSCDQLLTSTDDDDLQSDDSFSDYQLMPSPPSLCDDDNSSTAVVEVGHSTKFDTTELITPTSDAMWCDWSAATDNDLNSLLIFGP